LALATAGFSLGIRPVRSLRPHEETIPAHVKQIADEMIRDGVQKDPIIIDKESATVLDGMHRLAAFKELKVENAVCCSVDYGSRAVTLGRWARVYSTSGGDGLKEALGSVGEPARATLAEAFAVLERRDFALAVLTTDSAYLLGGREHEVDPSDAVRALDKVAKEKGWDRSFVPEDDIDVPLQEKSRFVVLTRRLTKEDVVRAARSGRLFPCKTSMHVIDPRPVSAGFPVARLNGATTELLRKHLAGKGGRIAPAGSVYEGRRYKERLLILNEG
jgi:hypothetical protein